LGIFEDFKVDQNPNKIDLSVGAYRDEQGKPYVLKSVLKAEQNLVDKRISKESDGEIGSEYFREVTFRLAVGDKLFDRSHVSVQVSFFFSLSSVCGVFIFVCFSRNFFFLSEHKWQRKYKNCR
jgi:aspartate/tyrosine/aromatic aminotransferase